MRCICVACDVDERHPFISQPLNNFLSQKYFVTQGQRMILEMFVALIPLVLLFSNMLLLNQEHCAALVIQRDLT